MQKTDKIFVAGHRGMVGSAIIRKLKQEGFINIVTRLSFDTDLRNQEAVNKFFSEEKPDYVFIAAAKVGGILANNRFRAEFLYDNLMIESNLVHAAWKHEVQKLLFLGSSCIYPRLAPQPLKEEYLLTGPLELTNEPYALAKIAGIKLCEAYRDQYGCNMIAVMPSNLYGEGDNYHPLNSHVIPGLIRRFHEAKINNNPCIEIWGTGLVLREFTYVDDLADACLFLMERYNERSFINVGSGQEISIAELAFLLKNITGYPGELKFDSSKPDGTPRKLLDSSRMEKLGWKSRTTLEQGLLKTYSLYLSQAGGK